MPNAFFRDVRSIRAQENIGVHSGPPLSVENDPMLKSHRSATTWRSEPEGLEDFKHLVTGPGRFAVTTSYREDLVHPGITFGSGFEKDRRPKIISGGIHRLAAMDLLDDMSGSVPEPSV